MAAPRKPADRLPKAAPPAPPKQVVIYGRAYTVPTQDDLSWGEIEAIELAFGCDFDKVSGMRLGMAMLWVAMRREVPSVSLDDVRGLTVASTITGASPDPPARTG